MDDYNGTRESGNFMELLMDGDYRNYYDYHDGGDYNNADNNNDGDNNDDDDGDNNDDNDDDDGESSDSDDNSDSDVDDDDDDDDSDSDSDHHTRGYHTIFKTFEGEVEALGLDMKNLIMLTRLFDVRLSVNNRY